MQVIQLQGDQRKNVSTFLVQVKILDWTSILCSYSRLCVYQNLYFTRSSCFLYRLALWRRKTSRFTVFKKQQINFPLSSHPQPMSSLSILSHLWYTLPTIRMYSLNRKMLCHQLFWYMYVLRAWYVTLWFKLLVWLPAATTNVGIGNKFSSLNSTEMSVYLFMCLLLIVVLA